MENQAEINSQAIFEYVKKLEKENQDLKSLVMDLHEYIQDLKEESEYYQWKCKSQNLEYLTKIGGKEDNALKKESMTYVTPKKKPSECAIVSACYEGITSHSKKRTLSFEEFKEKSPICQKQDANFTDHDNFPNCDFENNTKSKGKHSETDSQTSDITLKSTSRDKCEEHFIHKYQRDIDNPEDDHESIMSEKSLRSPHDTPTFGLSQTYDIPVTPLTEICANMIPKSSPCKKLIMKKEPNNIPKKSVSKIPLLKRARKKQRSAMSHSTVQVSSKLTSKKKYLK
ncbi:unnamed protein product [Moneuplotes crassus]|uniref:Uncharacterized protein n=1 Tax=Euplotes crassus TaxID=5936 RepID=A0AAD1UQA5_EUPCR|nr:unnamed protein product [Moneuplotes crassus]